MAQLEDWQPTLKAVRAAEWVDTWRRRATPQDAGPFRVRLPEHAPGPDRLDLVIEPGTSFGFGHPSTLLALELLADIPVAGATVADVGSGSGVLAIASRVLGALDVHAVDIASDAVAATRDNATRNGVEITVTAGSVDTLPRVVFDLVLANLTAATQAEVLPLLADRIGPSTTVVLSGLLDGQESRVSALVGSHEIAAVARRDGWIAVLLTASRIASPTS